MNNYYSGKLEIISLELAEESQDNYYCSLSLTKGIHQFGKLKFYIDKEANRYDFQQPRIINFYFPPKMIKRKDVYFKINFEDIDTGDHFGSISLSTNQISNIFSADKKAVIEEKKQLFEGAVLHYKVYMPKIEIQRQRKLGISDKVQKKQESSAPIDDIIFSLFSRPQAKSRKKVPQIKKQQKITENDEQEKKKANIMSLFNLLSKKTPSEHQQSNNNNDTAQIANNLMFSTMTFIKQQSDIKHTLMPVHESGHHQSSVFSVKIKTVIFLLIFGLCALIYDSLTDRAPAKIKIDHPKVHHKGKKKKNKHKTQHTL